MQYSNGVRNLLLERVSYQVQKTRYGIWRRFVYLTVRTSPSFARTARSWDGRCCTIRTASVPRPDGVSSPRALLPSGGFALGHAALGVMAIGQLGVGLLFGLGQASTGLYALGQVAIAALFGVGQFATGEVAIGQLAAGQYVLAQVVIGEHVWSAEQADPEAIAYFRDLWDSQKAWLRRA